ncbi:MAG: hypothetical protein HFE71_09675 [Emergencia sp.]|jgi:hypothetical protein|uniref:hypothetical protein n=1 Tax=Emergencia sp. JLR.KK010 TaxID=3114296 RepID=UPI0021733B9F|nr:hypothetical protein [Emergencia sp.]
MDKKEHLHLVEKGYVPVQNYVNENLMQNLQDNSSEEKEAAVCDFFSSLRTYESASQRFHQPGGDGYYIVQKCLQKYLDYKFIKKNNHFRFNDFSDYDEDDRADKNLYTEQERQFQYIPVQRKKEPMIGTQADIYYLLFEAEQESVASRRCKDYVKSNKLHLTAVLTSLIERVVTSMDNDERKKIRTYGNILRTTYMEMEYAEMEMTDLYQILHCSKKQYYTARNHAITLVSETLFGILAGETGLAELYINQDEIIIPSIKR